VRRLAKRSGVESSTIDQCFGSSQALRALTNLANSGKHGLGGRAKNASVLNGFVVVQRQSKENNEPDDTVHLVGMLVADAKEGTFPSGTILNAVIRQWGLWLQMLLNISSDWSIRCSPDPSAPVVMLKQGEHATIPAATVVVVELPAVLLEQFREDAKQRGQSA
jgi:hypothetical protein